MRQTEAYIALSVGIRECTMTNAQANQRAEQQQQQPRPAVYNMQLEHYSRRGVVLEARPLGPVKQLT